MDSRMNSVRMHRPAEHHLARLVGQQRYGHGGREKRGGVVALMAMSDRLAFPVQVAVPFGLLPGSGFVHVRCRDRGLVR